jgi:glyoxylase-like metal-dependent hydrolase (beta-lactamase superfamily II)
VLLCAAATGAVADEADRFAGVAESAVPVADGIYMLVGAGGNIGLSVGEDGTLIVDDQYAPLAQRIQAAIDELGGARPKVVLNTHYHGDHTGSNPFFGREGTIVAHDNVRLRLLHEPDFDPAGLPTLTFDERVHVHFNGDEIEVIHLPAGHTDGDSVVWFTRSNVLHAGDHLFNDRFPYIDLAAGGTVEGYIVNLKTIIAMVPDDVRVIPGHGELTDKAGLERSLAMIQSTFAAVQQALAAGATETDIIAAGVAERWKSFAWQFVSEDAWLRTLVAAASSTSAAAGDR